MPDIDHISAEIERMRVSECTASTARLGNSKEQAFQRLLPKLAGSDVEQNRWALCRARSLKRSSLVPSKGKRSAGVGGDMPEPLTWYDGQRRQPGVNQSSGEVGGWLRAKVGAITTSKPIIVAVDQYAEAALGNREFFLKQAVWDRR